MDFWNLYGLIKELTPASFSVASIHMLWHTLYIENKDINKCNNNDDYEARSVKLSQLVKFLLLKQEDLNSDFQHSLGKPRTVASNYNPNPSGVDNGISLQLTGQRDSLVKLVNSIFSKRSYLNN